MTLNIDIDGVIFPFEERFHAICSETLGKNLPKITQWDIAKSWGMTKKEFYHLFDLFAMNLGFLYGGATENALEVLSRLKEKHTINIVTSRGVKMIPHIQTAVRIQTCQWILEVGVPHHNLFFTRDKCKIPGLLLDDHIDYLAGCDQAVCFDQPWNQEWTGNKVSNWLEFEEYVNDIR